MTRGRIAVQIQTARRFQDTMQFQQAIAHHHEIRHHVVLAQKAAQRLNHLRRVGIRLMTSAHTTVSRNRVRARQMQNFLKLAFRLFAPMPRIFERDDLRFGRVPFRRFEQQVVIAFEDDPV